MFKYVRTILSSPKTWLFNFPIWLIFHFSHYFARNNPIFINWEDTNFSSTILFFKKLDVTYFLVFLIFFWYSYLCGKHGKDYYRGAWEYSCFTSCYQYATWFRNVHQDILYRTQPTSKRVSAISIFCCHLLKLVPSNDRLGKSFMTLFVEESNIQF